MIKLTSKLLQKRAATPEEAKVQVEKMRNFLTKKGFTLTSAGSQGNYSSRASWDSHHYYKLHDVEIVVWAEADENQEEDTFDENLWVACWNAFSYVTQNTYLGHGAGFAELVVFWNNMMENPTWLG
jgi:hypothetical protein